MVNDNAPDTPQPIPVTPVTRFFKLVALEKKEISAIYFYALLSGLISLSLPLGIQSIINYLFGGIISTSLVLLIGIVVAGVLANGWLQILQMQVNESIQQRIFARYSLQFAYKIPRLDLQAVEDYYLPELVNRFFDTAALQKGISKMLLEFPAATVQIVFGLALLSFYNAGFLVFSIVLVVLIAIIFAIVYPTGIKTSLEESNYKYEVGYWLEEVARMVRTIKFMGLNEYALQKVDKLVTGYILARQKHFKVLRFQYWCFVAFKVIITAGLLTVGSWLVFRQQLNIGQFIAAEIVILVVLNSVEKLIASLDVVYDMLTSLEKVSKILDKPDERKGGLYLMTGQKAPVMVTANNLTFNYGNQLKRPALVNVNFHIQPGESVCVLGSQGSGKSTLLKLLTGSYMGYSGQLLLNNYPLTDYHMDNLRAHVGVVWPQPDIIAGTLFENVTMGNTTITAEDVLKVAEGVGLIDYIRSSPAGLNTIIDPLGRKLPRTVVSQILILRTLLTNPGLLLLEDCWSNMERHEQETLFNYLFSNKAGYTMLAVTNHMDFARRCDKVMLFKEGSLLHFGTYNEVCNTAEYKRMFEHLSM